MGRRRWTSGITMFEKCYNAASQGVTAVFCPGLYFPPLQHLPDASFAEDLLLLPPSVLLTSAKQRLQQPFNANCVGWVTCDWIHTSDSVNCQTEHKSLHGKTVLDCIRLDRYKNKLATECERNTGACRWIKGKCFRPNAIWLSIWWVWIIRLAFVLEFATFVIPALLTDFHLNLNCCMKVTLSRKTVFSGCEGKLHNWLFAAVCIPLIF